MNVIETNQLTKRFGTFTAVDHINFEVGEGEIFGFLGANGAGKTTAMRMAACQQKGKQGDDENDSVSSHSFAVKVVPKYAEGYKVTYKGNICLLDIQDPQREEGRTFHFALVLRGKKADKIPSGYTRIEVPVKKVVCMTSLQLSNFIKLDALQFVTGMTSARHLFNADVKKRIAEGKIHKIGMEGNFDSEVVIAINPDVILISPFKRGGYDAMYRSIFA